VRGFFENGGRQLFVCRTTAEGATTARADAGDFEVRAIGPGDWGHRVWVSIRPQSAGFRVSAAYFAAGVAIYDPFDPANDSRQPRPQHQEEYRDLAIDPASPDYFGKRLDGDTRPVLFTLTLKPGAPGGALPVAHNGVLDDSVRVTDPQGVVVLDARICDDVSVVYAPAAEEPLQRALVRHCEQSRRRIAILDLPRGVTNPDSLDPRTSIGDSSYAASYWPWLWVQDPAGVRMLAPPGGHIAGIYARLDSERGVHKAPANEAVRGAVGLEYVMDDNQQDSLNPRGVNSIRSFPERGIRVWGARTLSSDAQWKYVNVRRLFLYLETSIYRGTQWVVFEPNDERLWARVRDTIRLFLRTTWRSGALQGNTEEHAFFVLCDRDTMTQEDILQGRLICEIGVAPIKPAEFVVFRIFQHTAEMQA
jgi:phage tail sheath protein FI